MADPYAPTMNPLTLPALPLADTLPPLTMGAMLSMPHYDASGVPSPLALPIGAAAGPSSRKRRASTPPADEGLFKRVRTEGTLDYLREEPEKPAGIDGRALAEELAQELQCACCAATIYRPVISRPCEHFFCGSCIALWIRNGGHNCPACRSVSESCKPSRSLENMANILIKHDPSRARAPREREQADEIYKGGPLNIPQPREPSPTPQFPTGDLADYARPCPHCVPGNGLRWTCPVPVRDPMDGLEGAWHLDDGTPTGHGWCGHCEDLLAVGAPSTTRCDLCLVAFCGLSVPDRCCALPLREQRLESRFSNATDLLLTGDIYEAFDGNPVEAEFFIEHLQARELSPREVYREIIQHILASPERFAPLIEDEIFTDTHSMPPVSPENDDPTAPRENICQACATEVFIWGVHDWWERERTARRCAPHVLNRRDCAEGRACMKQGDLAHAREFNHVGFTDFSHPCLSGLTLPVPNTSAMLPGAEEKTAGPSTVAVKEGGPVTTIAQLLGPSL